MNRNDGAVGDARKRDVSMSLSNGQARESARQFDEALASLVSEHAPHGFAGFMRGVTDGCQVYVAANALQDALRKCAS